MFEESQNLEQFRADAENEPIKISLEARSAILDALQQHIDHKSKQLETVYQPNFLRVQALWTHQQQQSLNEMNQVHELYHAAIERLEFSLEQLANKKEENAAAVALVTEQQKNRRAHLQQALERLRTYVDVLIHHTGMYVPADIVPIKELLDCLECANQETIAQINTIYQQLDNANWLKGINPTNIGNQWNYYSMILKGQDTEYMWEILITYIGNKIRLIESELAESLEEQAPESDYLPTPNLWTLNAAANDLSQTQADEALEYQQLHPEFTRLSQARQQALSSINAPMEELERDFSEADIDLKIQVIDYELTKIEKECYGIEFKLADVQERQNKVERIIEELNTKTIADALLYYRENKAFIMQSNINYVMTHKENATELSGSELIKNIEDRFGAQELAFEHLLTFIDASNKVSAPMGERITAITIYIQKLKSKKQKIDNEVVKLRAVSRNNSLIIKNKKELLLSHNQLISLKNAIISEFSDLLSGRNVAYENKSFRNTSIAALENLINTRFPLLNNFDCRNNEEVVRLHTELSLMADQLKLHYAKFRLVEMEDNNKALIKRFPVKTKAQRDRWIADVNALNARDAAFVAEMNYPLDAFIGAKLPIVKAQRIEVNAKFDQIKDLAYLNMLPEETPAQIFSREYTIRLQIISSKYFGTDTMHSAVFPNYLAERCLTYFLVDWIQSIASILFGNWGFKSDYSVREEFINQDLFYAFCEYQQAEECDKEECYQDLIELIDFGREQFKPRTRNSPDYALTMDYQLMQMRQDLEPVHNLLDKFEVMTIHP